MFKQVFLFIILIFSLNAQSQIQSEWEGHYRGNLNISQLSGGKSVYHMELLVQKETDSTWKWTIIYGEGDAKDERNYTLKSKGNSIYEIDEHNSIVLSCNLIKNQFLSVFEVQGNLLHIMYTFEEGQVIFDCTSSNNKIETGGGKDQNNSDIPLVYSYNSTTVQQAVLKKKNPE